MTARLAVRLCPRIRRNPQPLHTFPRYGIRARRVVSRLVIGDATNCRAMRQLQLMNAAYPVEFSIDYPDRDLNRLTTALRIFTVIPIAIVLGAINGYTARYGGSGTTGATTVAIGGTGLLFLPPLLMILFRQKYPRWWFDWNLQMLRFGNRIGVYFA